MREARKASPAKTHGGQLTQLHRGSPETKDVPSPVSQPRAREPDYLYCSASQSLVRGCPQGRCQFPGTPCSQAPSRQADSSSPRSSSNQEGGWQLGPGYRCAQRSLRKYSVACSIYDSPLSNISFSKFCQSFGHDNAETPSLLF